MLGLLSLGGGSVSLTGAAVLPKPHDYVPPRCGQEYQAHVPDFDVAAATAATESMGAGAGAAPTHPRWRAAFELGQRSLSVRSTLTYDDLQRGAHFALFQKPRGAPLLAAPSARNLSDASGAAAAFNGSPSSAIPVSAAAAEVRAVESLLQEYGATPRRRLLPASRGAHRFEGRGTSAGPGLEVILAAYQGCGGSVEAVRACLDVSMAFAEAPAAPLTAADFERRTVAWLGVLRAAVEFAARQRAASAPSAASAGGAPAALANTNAASTAAGPLNSGGAMEVDGGSPAAAAARTAAGAVSASAAPQLLSLAPPGSRPAVSPSSASVSAGEAPPVAPPLPAVSAGTSAPGAGPAAGGSSSASSSSSASASASSTSAYRGADPREPVTSQYVTAVLQAATAFCFAAAIAEARVKAAGRMGAADSAAAATSPAAAAPSLSATITDAPHAAVAVLLLPHVPPPRPLPAQRVARGKESPWADAEISRFTAGLARHGRVFARVAEAVNTRNVQACVAWYYGPWRKTGSYYEWRRKRDVADKQRRLEKEALRRDRAWFHFWRFDEDALGPAVPPAAVPLPPLLRVGIPSGLRCLEDGSVALPPPSRGSGIAAPAGVANGSGVWVTSASALRAGALAVTPAPGSGQPNPSPSATPSTASTAGRDSAAAGADTASFEGAASSAAAAAAIEQLERDAAAPGSFILPLVVPTIDILVDQHGTTYEAPPTQKAAAAGGSNPSAPPVAVTTRSAAKQAASSLPPPPGPGQPVPYPIGGNPTYVFGAAAGAGLEGAGIGLAAGRYGHSSAYAAGGLAGAGGFGGGVDAAAAQTALLKDLQETQNVDPLRDYQRVLAAAADAFEAAFAQGGGGSSAAGAGAGKPRPAPASSSLYPSSAAAPRAGPWSSAASSASSAPSASASSAAAHAEAAAMGHVPHIFSDSWIEDRFVENESYCAVCGDGGDLLCCEGPCRRSFHNDCLSKQDAGVRAVMRVSPALIAVRHVAGLPDTERDDWRCSGCVLGSYECFICGHAGQEGVDVFRCARMCGKHYHLACLARDPRTRWLPGNRLTTGLDIATVDAAGASLHAVGGVGSDPAAVAARVTATVALQVVPATSPRQLQAHWQGTAPAAASGAASAASTAAASASSTGGSAASAATAAALSERSTESCSDSDLYLPSHPTLAVPPGATTRFVCPFHTCAGCNQVFDAFHPPVYWRCHACPSAFHVPCVPPGVIYDMVDTITCANKAAHAAKKVSSTYKARSGLLRQGGAPQEGIALDAGMLEQLRRNAHRGTRIGDLAFERRLASALAAAGGSGDHDEPVGRSGSGAGGGASSQQKGSGGGSGGSAAAAAGARGATGGSAADGKGSAASGASAKGAVSQPPFAGPSTSPAPPSGASAAAPQPSASSGAGSSTASDGSASAAAAAIVGEKRKRPTRSSAAGGATDAGARTAPGLTPSAGTEAASAGASDVTVPKNE